MIQAGGPWQNWQSGTGPGRFVQGRTWPGRVKQCRAGSDMTAPGRLDQGSANQDRVEPDRVDVVPDRTGRGHEGSLSAGQGCARLGGTWHGQQNRTGAGRAGLGSAESSWVGHDRL